MGRETQGQLATRRASRGAVLAFAIALGLALAAPAAAHVERASYWPDPAPDASVSPAAGGAVPDVRPLATALDESRPGTTRVVCQGSVPQPPSTAITEQAAKAKRSLKKLRKKLKKAKAKAKAKKAKKGKKGKARKQRKKIKRLKKKIKRLKKQTSAAAQTQAVYEAALEANPSIQRLRDMLAKAEAEGYEVRPSQPRINVSHADALGLLNLNTELLKRCQFDSIQAAVTASGNNDRVVVMPGIYTEPESRAAPTNDPSCDQYEEVNDRPGGGAGGFQTGANTYTYIANCPNDQNLIAVIGREPRDDQIPPTPLDDRHGIPDLGPCLRCNLQLEGSGVSADDVVVDGGRVESGNGGPADAAKDVGIRADRADGFVLRNMTVRHVREHGIYPHEVDGFRLEQFKTFATEEYGVLSFAADHGLISDCDAAGSGDAALYPGSAPDTGEQTVEATQRYNTEIRRCDMHHSSAGYSGTAANGVWVHNNDFYDNALGFTTDVFTAAGHPGFPQDSDLIEDNKFYSNNFNPYLPYCDSADYVPGECSDINPTIPVPVGTGLWIAGGNNNIVRHNEFFDNWRRGTMLFAVPDAFVCGENPIAGGNQQAGCNELQINTSYRNRFHNNVMGQAPDGSPDPNGVDFWWDSFPANTNNCWYGNVGKDGTRGSLTSTPPQFPAAGVSVPLFLPEDCATSIGAVGAFQEVELLACLAAFDQDIPAPCTWFETPAEP